MLRACAFAFLTAAAGAAERPFVPPDPIVAMSFDRASLETRGDVTVARPGHPTATEGRVVGATPVEGVAGDALRFAGATDLVDLGKPAALLGAKEVTVSAWVRVEALADSNYVLSAEDWDSGETRGIVLRLGADGAPELTIGNGAWKTAKGAPIASKEWRHLAGTAGPREVTLWVDGKRVATAPTGGPPGPSPFGLTIGRGNYDRKRGFQGDIDEVAVWDRVLSEAEISGLYRRGKAGVSMSPRKDGYPAAWPVGPKPLVKGIEGATLRLDPKGRGIVVSGTKSRLTFHAGGPDGFGAEKVISVPNEVSGRHDFADLDFACDPSGSVHVVALFLGFEGGRPMRVAWYVRLSAAGEVLQPFTDLNAVHGLRNAGGFPAILPGEKGSLVAFVPGVSAKGVGVVARVEIGEKAPRAGRVQSRPGDEFVGLASGGRLFAVPSREPWMVSSAERDLVWTDLKTLKSSPCVRRALAAEMTGQDWQAHVTMSGEAWVAAQIPRDGTGGEDPESATVRLRLLRGRPGGALKEAAVLDGPFAAEHAYAFVESPGGKVWLVASVAEHATHHAPKGAAALAPDLRLAVWSLGGAKPECAGSFARARDARRISGAFADETTLHVVFGDFSGFWAETWKVEPPKAAAKAGPATPKPAAVKRK